jgi:thiol:disulfide interchange protein/DsbC/DsbD-like thiol-disulfide interchange protein
MPRLLYMLMTSLLLLMMAGAGTAQTPPNNVPATLVAETLTPAAGSTITVAIRFDPKPGWHGYWQNPGDAGFGGKFVWTLPGGVTAGEPAYPVPTRLVIAGLMNHVFEQEHALLVPVSIPAGLAKGSKLALRLRGDWLGCTDEICVPQGGDMALDLIVGDGRVDADAQAKFDRWRAKLPRPLGSAAVFERAGQRVRIGIPFPQGAKINDPWLFAATEEAISYVAKQSVSRNGDMLIIETDAAGAPFDRLSAVLAIGNDQGLLVEAKAGPVPPAGTPVATTTEEAGASSTPEAGGATLAAILLALGGALLGGLILNIMPCVFPIISLKALSLARSGGDERAARTEALAYTAGVIAVCVALGAVLLGLRAGGAAVGWAFQLQDPRVILVLLVLVSAIAFNLAGLFELGSLSVESGAPGRHMALDAFLTGALAAFVATPCTGPFMAAALGAALVLPAAAALAVFAGLGLGLALPFLLIGFVPAIRHRLPKPGPWMATLRTVLSIPMFLTALALGWLLGRQAGVNAMSIGLAAAMVAILLCWWLGRRQGQGLGGGWLVLAAVALTSGAAAYTLPIAAPSPSSQTSDTGQAEAGVTRFSEARLAELRAAGKPVFLYFTADWCITCKVNEKAAIDRPATRDAFTGADVTIMVGDWTNGDAEITRFLNAQGVSGVPLYLFYPKGGGDPKTLPQLLSTDMLTALVS